MHYLQFNYYELRNINITLTGRKAGGKPIYTSVVGLRVRVFTLYSITADNIKIRAVILLCVVTSALHCDILFFDIFLSFVFNCAPTFLLGPFRPLPLASRPATIKLNKIVVVALIMFW